MTQNKLIHVIIGPTASGKSAHALELAQKHNGVVINCDAMQSYDALHVLTAQPDVEEQAQAPHRLYGHLHPKIHYSAADWRVDAIKEIEQCFTNGQTPIICGGTGFYLKALMEGFSPVPEIPNEVRDKGIALQAQLGNPAFHEQLKTDDPMVDGKIDTMNTQRNIRAWEVFHHTGRSIVDWQNEPLTGAPRGYEFDVTALFPNREALIKKIHARLDVMMDLGILDEVRALDDRIKSGDVPDDSLVVKAHGFRPFRYYLNETWTLDQAIEQTQTETRQYAKRQMTWLRNQLNIDKIIETS
jgi:tRNA dimethylallyltransferase